MPEGCHASPVLQDNIGSIFFRRIIINMSKKEEKIFKTFEEQIEGLKRKNLKFRNEKFALNTLKRVNYYSLINAYKENFLDPNYKKISPDDSDEMYKENTFFENLFWLYYFDSEMRSYLLKYIFIAESNIKTKLAYYFCEKHKTVNNAYVEENNFEYTSSSGLTEDIDRLVQKLKRTINKQSDIQGSRINHYTTNYDTVPLWVLMPQLNFGTTAYFFKCSKKDIQSKIAKNLKFEFIEENSEFNDKYIFTGEALSDVIFFMNSFRNICAHNERLYDYKFTSDDININKFIVHEYYNLDFKYSLFDLILVLKFFISQLEYKAMISLIASCLAFLSENIDENNLIKILNKMKFPKNWKEILEIEEKFQRMKEFYKNQ